MCQKKTYNRAIARPGVKWILSIRNGFSKKTETIYATGAEDRNRTGTGFKARRILSPVRLPVPPLRQIQQLYYNNTWQAKMQ